MQALTTHSRAPGTSWLLVALAAAGLVGVAGVAGVAARWSLAPVALAAALVPATLAAVIDARVGRVPDRLVLASLVPSAAVLGHEIANGHGVDALGAWALGAAAFAGPLLVLHLASPSAMGFGDVKLAAALGAALGLVDPRAAVVALCVGSGVTGCVGLVTRRRTLPFGPGVVGGTVAALLLVVVLGGEPLPWR